MDKGRPTAKQFLGLMMRCKNEPYVKEFVDYYLSQGVDHIYIVDDGSTKDIYCDVLRDVFSMNRVHIFYDTNSIQKNTIKRVYDDIRYKYEWLIYVDADEFITTKKNAENTIRHELETTFKDCACVKVPWVMMSCNAIQQNPAALLHTNVYRWNHNNRHVNRVSREPKFRCRYDNIEVKCIFKPALFDAISDHHPTSPNVMARVVESVHNTKQPLDPFYAALREQDIAEGYMLCYHYRLISVDHCLEKIKHNIWYKRYTLTDLLSNDYPEVVDETMRAKIHVAQDI